jgi:hypothetical protein
MAVMNMVNSNVNQWTMLAAMIPVVYSISRGVITPVVLDDFHSSELALTIAQSLLGGLLLLDLEFSVFDAAGIFLLWIIQFVEASLREPITVVYVLWAGWVIAQMLYRFARTRRLPKALAAFGTLRFGAAAH